MSKFESSIKQIAYPQQSVYNMLSDLTNIERVKDKVPEDKLKDLTFDKDTISISVSPVGQISMRIVERDEPKTIKFASENSPMSFNFWIQILPVSDTASKMKLTIDADIPFFRKRNGIWSAKRRHRKDSRCIGYDSLRIGERLNGKAVEDI